MISKRLIDFRSTEPFRESKEEFLWFVEQMRKALEMERREGNLTRLGSSKVTPG